MYDFLVLLLLRYWEISDPIQVLRKCIKDKKWFEGIVLSTTFFEGVGTGVLKAHFQNRIDAKKFERIRSVEQIIVLLHASGIIKEPTYSKMVEVNKFRNSMVHFELSTPQPQLEPKEAKRIIQKAISCLGILYKKQTPMRLEFLSPKPNDEEKRNSLS